MPLTLSSSHQDFFSNHHYIEFNDLLSSSEIKQLQKAIHEALIQREKKIIETRSPKELFKAGRDLFRDHPIIKKFVLHKRFAKIASALFNEPILRLAYDQALCSFSQGEPIFSQPLSLQQISSFQSIVGGIIIRLSDDPNPPDLLPQKAGNLLFIAPTFPLPWSSFFQQTPQSFFLITYCGNRTVYVLENTDPHTHALKKLGYGFGDLLEEKTHPIVFNRKA